jgi:DNA replication protein DnaC
MEVRFVRLAERCARDSVILTSNLPFSRWQSIFKDLMTTAAAIDRLVRHCVTLELDVASYAPKRPSSPPNQPKTSNARKEG